MAVPAPVVSRGGIVAASIEVWWKVFMSKGDKSAQVQDSGAAERERRQRANRQGLAAAGIAVGSVVVILVAMVIARATGILGSEGVPLPSGSAADAVVEAITSVDPEILDEVGRGDLPEEGLPQPIEEAEPLTEDGLPLVAYFGAEYCPYCAAERWAVVVALSRFGSFSDLGLTRSGSEDVYPNTHTPSFHGSTFTSDYLVFQGVEIAGNELVDGSYPVLDSLTSQQVEIMETYNAPPYVSEDASGAIPFMVIGNAYLLSGSSFSPKIIQDVSATDIASALADPDTEIAQRILGSANALTTAICELTGGEPGEVCESPAATAYAESL